MNRRKLLVALFQVGPLVTFCAAKDQGKGKGKKKENQQGDDQGGNHDSHYFRREDYDAVRRYYTGTTRSSPRFAEEILPNGQIATRMAKEDSAISSRAGSRTSSPSSAL